MTVYKANRKRKRELRREQDREYVKEMREDREKHPQVTWWNRHWFYVLLVLWGVMILALIIFIADLSGDAAYNLVHNTEWENSALC